MSPNPSGGWTGESSDQPEAKKTKKSVHSFLVQPEQPEKPERKNIRTFTPEWRFAQICPNGVQAVIALARHAECLQILQEVDQVGLLSNLKKERKEKSVHNCLVQPEQPEKPERKNTSVWNSSWYISRDAIVDANVHLFSLSSSSSSFPTTLHPTPPARLLPPPLPSSPPLPHPTTICYPCSSCSSSSSFLLDSLVAHVQS